MFKEMKYSTLGKLIKTFKDSYEASWHAVIKVNIGLPFSYDSEDVSRLYWKLKKVNIEDKEWKDCEEIFDSYSRECVGVYDYFAYNGKVRGCEGEAHSEERGEASSEARSWV